MPDAQVHDVFEDLDDALRRVADHATAQWFSGANLAARPIFGGLSGAAVVRLDVAGHARSGVYILKVSVASQPDLTRTAAHQLATQRDAEFAESHLPGLSTRGMARSPTADRLAQPTFSPSPAAVFVDTSPRPEQAPPD